MFNVKFKHTSRFKLKPDTTYAHMLGWKSDCWVLDQLHIGHKNGNTKKVRPTTVTLKKRTLWFPTDIYLQQNPPPSPHWKGKGSRPAIYMWSSVTFASELQAALLIRSERYFQTLHTEQDYPWFLSGTPDLMVQRQKETMLPLSGVLIWEAFYLWADCIFWINK